MYENRVKLLSLLLCGAVLCSVCLTAQADKSSDPWQYSDLGKSEFGELWMGPAVNREAMEGKIVLVCMLGSYSSSKIAMKNMAKLDKTYRRSGLFAIGANYYNIDQEKRCGQAKAVGARYSIVNGCNIEFKNVRRKGVKKKSSWNYFILPYGVLYGPNGKILWEGKFPPSYSKINSIVRRVIGRAKSKSQLIREKRIRGILEGGDYSQIDSAVKYVKTMKLGGAYKVCERLKEKEGELGEQAQSLLNSLDSFAEEELSALEEKACEEPSNSIRQVLWLKKAFAGCKYSQQAKDLLAKWKKSKDFQTALKAEKAFDKFLAASKKIPFPEDYEGGADQWQRKYSRKLEKLKAIAKRFCDKYPDTAFVGEVEGILEEYEAEPGDKDDEKDEDDEEA